MHLEEILEISHSQLLHSWRIFREAVNSGPSKGGNLPISSMNSWIVLSPCETKIWTRCIKRAFHMPSSNSCIKSGTSMSKKLKLKGASDENTFWNAGIQHLWVGCDMGMGNTVVSRSQVTQVWVQFPNSRPKATLWPVTAVSWVFYGVVMSLLNILRSRIFFLF